MQELNSYVPDRNKEDVLENRASHIISSAINLMEMIYANYSPEEAELMEKRFISSIKGRDPKRFGRAVGRVKESLDDGQG
jgi:hypothetical protein